MKKLYAVMLGGLAKGCNIELHDIIFAVGSSLEDTYPTLVNKWFGVSHKLHIDCAVEITNVNGYNVNLSDQKPQQIEQLYCINFGGYQANFFGELHEVGFYIAQSEIHAKELGFNDLCVGAHMQHSDNRLLIEDGLVDDIFIVDQIDKYYVHLEKTDSKESIRFLDTNYIRLDSAELLAKSKSVQDD